MFEEYKKEVLEFYFFKKKTNGLSSNLENPGRLKLKKECLKIFLEKYTEKDDEMLRLFFDPSNKFNDHVKSIEKFELDKFRPIVNFLQKGTSIRDDHSVKLIAWLTHFDSYQDWRLSKETKPSEEGWCADECAEAGPEDHHETEREALGTDSDKDLGIVNAIQKNPVLNIRRPLSIKNMILRGALFLLIGGGAFFLVVMSTAGTVRKPSAGEECMYWNGDHYVPVRCDEKIKDATLVPLNLQILNNLRKINLTDTLTANSLGKVWYSRIGGKHEFFTDSGVHPVDTFKRLKPLTTYILNKHVSYYRYLLTRLMWSVSVIVTVILSMACVIYFFWRRKNFGAS